VPRRLSRARAAQLAVLVVSTVVVAGCGGLLGEDNGPPPDPLSPDVVAARELALGRADAALHSAAMSLGAQVVGRTAADACYEGQNNYKRSEGFDHRCTIRRAIVVVFDGDFRKLIAELDEGLFAAGWNCGGSLPCDETNSGLVDEYWDFRRAEHGGQEPPISSLPTTGMYERDGAFLEVEYAGPDLAGRGSLEDWHRRRRGGLVTSYEKQHPLDVDAVLARAADLGYVIALAVEIDYFEDAEVG
jgi:hypothetical protein